MPRRFVVALVLATLYAPGAVLAAPPAPRQAEFKGRLSTERWTVRTRWIKATRANHAKLQRQVTTGLRAKALGNVVVLRRYLPEKRQGESGLRMQTFVRLRQADATQPLALPQLGGKPALAGPSARAGIETILRDAVLTKPTRSALLDAAVKGVLDEKPMQGAEVYRRALYHAAASLGDKYSSAFSPANTVANTKRNQAKVVGVGLQLKRGSGGIEVEKAFADTPAGRALKAGDRILAINGSIPTSTKEATQLLSGAEGSHATIDYERRGVAKRATLGRIEYRAPQVDWRTEEGAIVVKLKAFREGIAKEIKDAIQQGQAKLRRPPRGVVLDLRGNGGGSVLEARRLISLFTTQHKLYTCSYRDKRAYTKRDGEALFADMRLQILVDSNSASASEIVAGTLSALGRAKLVGDKTFGKGIKQRTDTLADGSSLKLTNAFIEILQGGDIDRPQRYHGEGFRPAIDAAGAARRFPSAADPVLAVALTQLPR